VAKTAFPAASSCHWQDQECHNFTVTCTQAT